MRVSRKHLRTFIPALLLPLYLQLILMAPLIFILKNPEMIVMIHRSSILELTGMSGVLERLIIDAL